MIMGLKLSMHHSTSLSYSYGHCLLGCVCVCMDVGNGCVERAVMHVKTSHKYTDQPICVLVRRGYMSVQLRGDW